MLIRACNGDNGRLAHTRGRRRPIWVIASGGEVFILKRSKGAFTWLPATEADFGVQSAAANDPLFDNLTKH